MRSRVGRTIRQLRLLNGWSQEEFAERAGSSAKHLGRIERGLVDLSLNRLAEIANALSVSVGDLFAEARGRPVRRQVHVITSDDLATLDRIGDIVRRIKLPRARPAIRSSK